MIGFVRRNLIWFVGVGALTLAAASGYLTSVALSASTQAPTVTTTINIPTGGAPGPAGPAGPAGPPGPA